MCSLMRRLVPALLAGLCIAAGAPGPAAARDPALAKARFLDARLSVDKRVADLLARMTLDEKIAQLNGTWLREMAYWSTTRLKFAPGNERARALLANGLGEISRAVRE